MNAGTPMEMGEGRGRPAAAEAGPTWVLEARDLRRTFRTPVRSLEILRGASMGISEGEIVVVVGASGVGKSTLLHLLGGLDTPTAGEVYFRGEPVSSLPADRMASFRNRSVGFVFQFHHLLPEFTAVENVMMPALVGHAAAATARRKAAALLEEVGLCDRMDHRPDELSGGEHQRVAVARALVNDPDVVLADEPSGNLDRETAVGLHRLLRDLARGRRQAFVIVTHDAETAVIADRVLVLADGVLKERPRSEGAR
jgi:lipoprotein-releasing system ATP-binding protein